MTKSKAELLVSIESSKTINDPLSEIGMTNRMEYGSLEVSRQILREKTLSRFNYIRTCVLARELCLLVRTNRVAFHPEDVEQCCSLISKLCKEAGCVEQSKLCHQAADLVTKSEEEYLENCQQSCMKCGEARQPRQKKKTTYVA